MKRCLYLFAMALSLSCMDLLEDIDSINLYRPNDKRPWTFMMYVNGDNNLETSLMNDINEMKTAMSVERDIYVIVLVDRHPQYSSDSSILGDNFASSRLYDIRNGKALRISGREVYPLITHTGDTELDMGSAATLRDFIRLCKKYYPADHYALIIEDHGSGVKYTVSSSLFRDRSVSEDYTEGTRIKPSEFTTVLTSSESVDLIGFDACYMGCAEMAYQIRPGRGLFSAGYMVASAPSEWTPGWDYQAIFSRIDSDGGNNGETDGTVTGFEVLYPSNELEATDLCRIFVEEYADLQVGSDTVGLKHSLCSVDLSKIVDVKSGIDTLAASIGSNYPVPGDCLAVLENIRSTMGMIKYSENYESYPYVDIYNLCTLIENDASLSSFHVNAAGLRASVDSCVIASYGAAYYTGFEINSGGLSVIFPASTANWALQAWYYPWITSSPPVDGLDWCESCINGSVDNWCELFEFAMDSGSPVY